MFNFLQKKQKQKAEQQSLKDQQAEALVRGKKLEAFIIEVMQVAVRHDVSVSDFKVLLNEVSRQLEQAFDSRKVTEFMDKEEVAAVMGAQTPPATDAEVAESTDEDEEDKETPA